MQFMVTAYDFTDDDAINRRMKERETHLAGVKEMIRKGQFISGGAMLDNKGKMIGSTLHLEFGSREELDKTLQADPYVAGRVWEKIEIREIKLVPLGK